MIYLRFICTRFDGFIVISRALKTTTGTLNFLNNLNISAVTLAHNHVYDNLKDGFVKTVSFLESQKIRYMGAGLSATEATRPLILK